MISYAFFVVEEYDDQAPEPFGTVTLDSIPKIGDVVTLRWLGGKIAHDAAVTRINVPDLKLTVRSVD